MKSLSPGKNADHAIEHQTKQVNRLSVHDLDASPIDWSKFSLQRPQDLTLRPQKKLRDDQKAAQADALKGFAEADRGKLIMACGTGKTFTALRIAEKIAPKGHVLFLVPSLSLMSQSLREWTAESVRPIHSLAVCSDTTIGKRTAKTGDDKSDITTYDLAFPATTSARQIVQQHRAIEILSQHLITRPVFDALFENYAFTAQNPVSIAMQQMLDTLQDQALEKETAALEKFYASVRQRASGIDNAEGRQRVVIELYDKFFRTAFPKMAERLGIVYTLVEVVDFIIRSVEDVLQHEFRSSLGAQDVHVIDPFTGTGTFIVRLLQSGLIAPADLLRKYQHELHANEIVLLAYYIAAINIEETFHGLRPRMGGAGDSPAPVGDPPTGTTVSYLRKTASSPVRSAAIVGFVTNGKFIDGSLMDGLRACVADELTSIYVFKEPEGELVDGYRRRSAITDSILADFRAAYETSSDGSSRRKEALTAPGETSLSLLTSAATGQRITKEDIFYYIYGVPHSPEYRTRFASDLKKMLPRLPFTRETADFWRFSQAGRDLAQWHLNYETVEPWPVQEFASELLSDPAKDFLVQKMNFGRKDRQVDKTTIHYNAQITLTGIPLEGYDYVVNGKPALEWLMERYQVTVEKDSGIRNDPNDWAREHHQPRYILDLLKRVVRVSLETMKIVNALPGLNERK